MTKDEVYTGSYLHSTIGPLRSLARDAAAGRVTMADGYGADVAAWLPYWLLRALFFAPSAPFCRPHHRPRGRRHCCTTRPCRERPAALWLPAAAAGDDQATLPLDFFREATSAGQAILYDILKYTMSDPRSPPAVQNSRYSCTRAVGSRSWPPSARRSGRWCCSRRATL
jgi:hypothetical protein